MDGREGMTLQGSASYYLHRGGGIDGSGGSVHGGAASSGIHSSPAYKNLANTTIPLQPPNVGSSFHMESSSQSFSHGRSLTVALPGGEPVKKKKRGRPRKYAPDGAGANTNTGLGLSPMSAPKPSSSLVASPGEKVRRGRPPGSGWKQKLAPLGEWMNNSAGLAFTPHVLHVGVGEDVAAKIVAFAQQRPRALCNMSDNGSVSAITLRQPTTSNSTVTYEDDEYFASLQADREKELKAKEEAEAALAEERHKENEFLMQQQEAEEIERQLAANEASLPPEPTQDDNTDITLLVQMPDGQRRSQRFKKSDKLQVNG